MGSLGPQSVQLGTLCRRCPWSVPVSPLLPWGSHHVPTPGPAWSGQGLKWLPRFLHGTQVSWFFFRYQNYAHSNSYLVVLGAQDQGKVDHVPQACPIPFLASALDLCDGMVLQPCGVMSSLEAAHDQEELWCRGSACPFFNSYHSSGMCGPGLWSLRSFLCLPVPPDSFSGVTHFRPVLGHKQLSRKGNAEKQVWVGKLRHISFLWVTCSQSSPCFVTLSSSLWHRVGGFLMSHLRS
jgi:hypothetical protein